MITITLDENTFAVLLAGIYCTTHDIDSRAIPESVFLEVAEKLSYFMPVWDYDKISFEDWIRDSLLIYPMVMIEEEDLKELKENTLYWEIKIGNLILSVSMDIGLINNEN